jgi:hypothetical protein
MARRRLRTAALWIVALALVAGPAAASGDFTGTEAHEQELACPAPGQGTPSNQDPPGPGDCPGEQENETYRGRVWTNEVKCNSGSLAGAEGVNVYATGDPGAMFGGAGVCNDGNTAPVQGRIVVTGSMEQGGFAAYADGTKHNTPEQLQGWARVDASTSRQGFGCGSDDGKRDATAGEQQSPDNCG